MTGQDKTPERGGTGRGRRSHYGWGAGRGGRGGPCVPRNFAAGRIRNMNLNFKGETDAMKSHMFLTFEEYNAKLMFKHPPTYRNVHKHQDGFFRWPSTSLSRPGNASHPLPPENILMDDAGNVTDLRWLFLWNEEVKRYTKKKGKLQDNLSAIYAIVWGQCSLDMQAKIKSQADFDETARNAIAFGDYKPSSPSLIPLRDRHTFLMQCAMQREL